jgi:hypothetical protein
VAGAANGTSGTIRPFGMSEGGHRRSAAAVRGPAVRGLLPLVAVISGWRGVGASGDGSGETVSRGVSDGRDQWDEPYVRDK